MHGFIGRMSCRIRVGLFVSLGAAATGALVVIAAGCASYASPIAPDPGDASRKDGNDDERRDASARDASDAAQSVPADPVDDAATTPPSTEPPENAGTCINIDGTYSITCAPDDTCAVIAPRDPDDFGGDKSPRMQCESKKYKTSRCGKFWCGIGCICEDPEERLCRCADDHQAYEPDPSDEPDPHD